VIRAYESELKDSTDFLAWQVDARAADEEARLIHVEMKRKEMIQSAINAQEAIARQVVENHELAAQMKEEAVKGLQEMEHELQLEQEEREKAAAELRVCVTARSKSWVAFFRRSCLAIVVLVVICLRIGLMISWL
jgi:hypothetical protein